MTRRLSDDEKRDRRRVRQITKQKRRMPRVVGEKSLTPVVKVKTVHASELSNLKMMTGGEKKWRIVIDYGVMAEWIGFGWIVIRRATPDDLRNYPRVVR